MMPIQVNGKSSHRAAGPLQRDFGNFRTPGLESAFGVLRGGLHDRTDMSRVDVSNDDECKL